MIEHLELFIDELLLDLDNPRLGSTSSQSEALASIVRLNPGYFQNLMGNISTGPVVPFRATELIAREGDVSRIGVTHADG